ncbi:MAG: RagB/SusD family nutrient uptake outer membrane protein, partial [Muribaculum sp.]|nr:RagB/SusD family nutrient uptake outer membrane protein [Muribaculum sp.]
ARYQTESNFVDEKGRLPEAGRKQVRNGETTFSGKLNQPILNSWILYKNGEYVGDNFGNTNTGAYGSHGSNMYPGVIKHTCGYLDAYAGDNGSRDIILARLGETYLVRAEIKVRLNDYAGAKEDINVLRRRAAWKNGENRSYFVDGCFAAANTNSNVTSRANRVAANEGWNLGMNSYYLSNPDLEPTTASTEAAMTNWDWNNLPAEDEAILQRLGVSSQYDRAINFILNEHTRELVGEMVRWEHLSRTKTLGNRAVKLNKDVLFFADKHYLRPIPQAFLDNLQNADGTNLSDADKAAWQNPGY